jgi:hypothetical protein
MKHKLWATAGLVLAIVVGLGCVWRYRRIKCEARGATYYARFETLKRDAHQKLRIGTNKETVIKFFAEEGLPVTFTPNEATGTIYLMGCSPFGCGSDEGLLGVRVTVDAAGTTVSEPTVGALYTDCL